MNPSSVDPSRYISLDPEPSLKASFPVSHFRHLSAKHENKTSLSNKEWFYWHLSLLRVSELRSLFGLNELSMMVMEWFAWVHEIECTKLPKYTHQNHEITEIHSPELSILSSIESQSLSLSSSVEGSACFLMRLLSPPDMVNNIDVISSSFLVNGPTVFIRSSTNSNAALQVQSPRNSAVAMTASSSCPFLCCKSPSDPGLRYLWYLVTSESAWHWSYPSSIFPIHLA